MFFLYEQDLLSEVSTYTLRKAELEIVHTVDQARRIRARKLKRADKAFYQGVIENYIDFIYAIRNCLRSRGCILYKKPSYVKLLGEAK